MMIETAVAVLVTVALGAFVPATGARLTPAPRDAVASTADQGRGTDASLILESLLRDLTALLHAGLPATTAWRAVTADQPAPWHRMHAALTLGRGVAESLCITNKTTCEIRGVEGLIRQLRGRSDSDRAHDRHARSQLALTWQLIEDHGFLALPTTQAITEHLDNHQELARLTEIATAAPRATLRALAAVPLIGWLLGYALGANPIGSLLLTTWGWGCLIVGGCFIATLLWWTSQLVRRATARDKDAEWWCCLLTLTAAGLRAGNAPLVALENVTRAASHQRVGGRVMAEVSLVTRHVRLGAPWQEVAQQAPPGSTLRALCHGIALAQNNGAPVAAIVQGQARALWVSERHSAQRNVAALSTRMVIPIAMCGLPAFMAIAVVPIVVHLVTSVS